ncbi:MAG: hypothetical protein U0263_32610 [Polyangiaceae bacterium]
MQIVNDDDLTQGASSGSLEIIKMHGCLGAPDSIASCRLKTPALLQ